MAGIRRPVPSLHQRSQKHHRLKSVLRIAGALFGLGPLEPLAKLQTSPLDEAKVIFSSRSTGGDAVRKVSIALLLACFLLTAVAQTQKESSPPAPEVKIGVLAPDFTLVDHNGKPRSLHDYKGKKNVALAFYVWAFSAD